MMAKAERLAYREQLRDITCKGEVIAELTAVSRRNGAVEAGTNQDEIGHGSVE